MAASAQLQGISKVFVENFVHRSHFVSIHDQTPIGYFSSCGFSPVTFDSKFGNSKEVTGMIGLDPRLDVERCFSTSKNEIPLFPGASEVASYLDIHKQYKNINVLEPLGAPPFAASTKKFILFDRSGDNGRGFCQPNAVCDFMASTAEGPDKSSSGKKLCHFQGYQPIFKIQEQNNVDSVPGMRARRVASQNICNINDPLQIISHGICEADSMSHISCRESSQREGTKVSGSLHEDTQDLEALMSSDEDEKSTGHSPSDLTWNDMLTNSSNWNFAESYSGACKRKTCDYQCFDEDEVDLSGQEVESKLKENESLQSLDLGCMNDGNRQNILSLRTFEPVKGSQKSDAPSCLHLSRALQNDFNTELCQEYTLHYGQSTPRKRLRKEKIKTTVKLLRSIIPGGNSMDTADVLGEAIQYVRTLQLKVSKLEMTKRARI
ncbi:hypothetical protein O6H91_09G042600 [Diphasiastrum complanatum]|nr:hypothetical protein O6H91_09G042600 [Diphasiastrum complanatum]